jgi:hypothetical protein
MAPPEHGGVLNLPASMRTASGGVPPLVRDLIAMLGAERREAGLPNLQAFWLETSGNQTPITTQLSAAAAA